MSGYSASSMQRFRSMLGELVKQPTRAGLTPCLRWKGKLTEGYGKFYLDGEAVSAPRASYMIFVGPVAVGQVVRHRCDNAWCVNPLHLEVGTQADNVADKVARGRQARGDGHGARLHPESRPRGERVWAAKLESAQVKEIRSRAERGETKSSLARAFGVSPSTICKIVLGRAWLHVR